MSSQVKLKLIFLLTQIWIISSQYHLGSSTVDPQSTTTNDFCSFTKTKKPSVRAQLKGDCRPGEKQSICNSWRADFVIVLRDATNADNYLEQIKLFMNQTTATCSTTSEMQLFTSRSKNNVCAIYKFGTIATKNAIEELDSDSVVVNSTRSPGKVFIERLMMVNSCLSSTPLTTVDAAILYIFTDLRCTEICQGQPTEGQLQSLLNTSLASNFIIRFVFMGTDYPDDNEECLEQLTSPCTFNDNSQQCELLRNADIKNSQDYSICQTTQDKKKTGLSTTDLFLVTSLPSLALIISVIIACACCYKQTKHRRRVIELYHRHFNKNGDSYQRPNYNNLEGGSNFIPTFAAANHYMDIRKLAAANKKDDWEINSKNLIVHEGEILGNGAFANVYKGTIIGKLPLLKVNTSLNLNLDTDTDGPYYAAVKRMPAHADHQNHLDFFHEIQFMKNLGHHSHVISMLGCVSNPFEPLIVVEYCSRGDLLKFLRRHRDYLLMSKDEDCPVEADMCLRIKDLVSISWQVSDGMAYLASKNFIHRDLAARNVLLTNNMTAKISDFGLCRYIDSALYTAKGGRLPIKWMSLESLKFYEFSAKSDVWSFGVLLFEIFSMGDAPYPTIQPTDMMDHLEQGNRLPQPERCPNEIYKIMQRCWTLDCVERPDFNEIRSDLTMMLNLDDESYGYLNLEERPKIDSIGGMLQIAVSKSMASISSSENQPSSPVPLKREGCEMTDDDLLETLHEESIAQDEMDEKCLQIHGVLVEHFGDEQAKKVKEILCDSLEGFKIVKQD